MAQSVEFMVGEMKYKFDISINNKELKITCSYKENTDIIWEGLLLREYRRPELSLERIFEIVKLSSLGKNSDDFKIIFPTHVLQDVKLISIYVATSIEGIYYIGENIKLGRLDLKHEKKETRTKLIADIAQLSGRIVELTKKLAALDE
jgi:hypothetical protein